LQQLRALARGIDRLNDWVGRAVSWLTLIMVLVTVVIVVLRYGFNVGFIWMQESVRFMHAFVFLLCAGYTLLHNGHVRVDIFYLKMSERRKAMVDIFGSIFFLIPVCSAILFYSWDYVLNSWAQLEGSLEERGLHAVYLLKTAIWAFSVLMILQAISRVIHGTATLTGREHLNDEEEEPVL
jgi:TRAP-type mannitol/chloroaromatic compound transport system permease small subunit